MTPSLTELAQAWVDAERAEATLSCDASEADRAVARSAFLTASRQQAARIAELEAEISGLKMEIASRGRVQAKSNSALTECSQTIDTLRAEDARLREALENLGAAAYFVLTESNGIDDNVWTLSDGSKVEWDYPIESFRRAIKWLNAAWEAAGGVRRRPESRAARAAESEER